VTRIGVRYRTLRLCSGGGGFEAIPETSQRLDLPSIRQRLEAEGSSVTDARVMLIIAGTPEVTISSAGRVLIKSSDRSLAERAFERIRPLLGPPS
jgi:hypothetical protein